MLSPILANKLYLSSCILQAMHVDITPSVEQKMGPNNKTLLIRFIFLIGLTSFLAFVGYNFATEGIHDAVIFTPVIDDFMWGILCSLIGVVSFLIAYKASSLFTRSRYVLQGAFFLLSGLSMLFDGINAVL